MRRASSVGPPHTPVCENPLLVRAWRELGRYARLEPVYPCGRDPDGRRLSRYSIVAQTCIPLALLPYVLNALPGWLPGIEHFGPDGTPFLRIAVHVYAALYLPLVYVALAAAIAAAAIPQLRQRRLLDELLMTRLSSGEIMVGAVGAALLPYLMSASLVFLVWLCFPPFDDAAHLLIARSALPPRELLLWLWVDTLALMGAAASVGTCLTVETPTVPRAYCYSMALFVVAPLCGLDACGVPVRPTHRWGLFWEPVAVGPSTHLAVLAACLYVALTFGILAQLAMGQSVALLPGMLRPCRVSPRGILVVGAIALAPMLLVAFRCGPPVGAERLLNETDAVFRAGQYRKALAGLDPSLRGERAPADWTWDLLWMRKVACHKKLQEYRETVWAAEEWRRSTRFLGSQASAWIAKGDAWRRLGSRRKSDACYQEGLALLHRGLRMSGAFAARNQAEVQRQYASFGTRFTRSGDDRRATEACLLALSGDDPEMLALARKNLAILRARSGTTGAEPARAPQAIRTP